MLIDFEIIGFSMQTFKLIRFGTHDDQLKLHSDRSSNWWAVKICIHHYFFFFSHTYTLFFFIPIFRNIVQRWWCLHSTRSINKRTSVCVEWIVVLIIISNRMHEIRCFIIFGLKMKTEREKKWKICIWFSMWYDSNYIPQTKVRL